MYVPKCLYMEVCRGPLSDNCRNAQKLVSKESERLTGIPEGADGLAEDGDAAGSDADADDSKKKKGPNMNRLLKSRLQKLVLKSDDEYVLAQCLQEIYLIIP